MPVPGPGDPQEDDALLSEVLLCLASQPPSLPRASVVCRRWRRLVSDPGFFCRFRTHHHHRGAPLIGYFTRDLHGPSFFPTGDAPNRVPRGRFSLQSAAKVNSLTSPSSKLPYPYYSLLFCAPKDGVNRAAESLGELLLGDHIETSPYRFSMLKNATAFLCRTDPVSPTTADLIKSRINDAYHVNLLLDTLPVVRYVRSLAVPDVLLRSTGFPVGIRADDGEYYVYNHLKLTVLVNKQKNGTTRVEALMATSDAAELMSFSGGKECRGYTVVGFEVVPCSIDHDEAATKDKKMYDEFSSKAATGCDPSVVAMRLQANRPLVFSYEVTFGESSVEWPSWWDAYLEMGGSQVHWFSIRNSIVVVAFLAAIVLVILLCTDKQHTRALACVYSSETGVWGDLISMPLPVFVTTVPTMIATNIPSVLIGDSLYWLLNGSYRGILEFDLDAQSLAVMSIPVEMYPALNCHRVIPAEGGLLN